MHIHCDLMHKESWRWQHGWVLAVSRPTSVQSVSAHLLEHWHLKLFLQRCTPYPCKKSIQINWIPVNLQPTNSHLHTEVQAEHLLLGFSHQSYTAAIQNGFISSCLYWGTKNISNHLLRAEVESQGQQVSMLVIHTVLRRGSSQGWVSSEGFSKSH